MFPFDIEDEEIEPIIEEDTEPRDYEIDFETGRLTGRIITGLDAILQWARIVLSTERYFYNQYSWEHGCELNSLIGKGYSRDYIDSEVRRMIEDALLVDENILAINDLECEFDDEKLSVRFELETIYGGGEVVV